MILFVPVCNSLLYPFNANCRAVAEVFLPFLPPLILTYIDTTTTYHSGNLNVSAMTLMFICKMLIYSSDIALSITMLKIADRGSRTLVT